MQIKVMPATSLREAIESGFILETIDGRRYDKNGLRISYAKNYSTAYYNVSYVQGFDGSGKPVYRANVRVTGDNGGSHIHHLSVHPSMWEAAWVANNFMANYDSNIKKWQATGMVAYTWECESEIPAAQPMFDPESCRQIRADVDAACAAQREKSVKAKKLKREQVEKALHQVRENEDEILRRKTENEELKRFIELNL